MGEIIFIGRTKNLDFSVEIKKLIEGAITEKKRRKKRKKEREIYQFSYNNTIFIMNRKKLDNSLTIPKISINSINTYLLIGINIMYVVWIAES